MIIPALVDIVIFEKETQTMNNQPENMFIDTIEQRYPERILKAITIEDEGFTAHFDLPNEQHLKVEFSVFEEDNSFSVHEQARASDGTRYLLRHSKIYAVSGESALALLEKYLRLTLGILEEHCYEDSFAEMILTAYLKRMEREKYGHTT